MKFLSSSIGHKLIMAITGTILLLFVLGHLVGNLGIFSGREAFNDYAAFLKSVPKLLWTTRIALIAAFVLHIFSSIRLSISNRLARPLAYAQKTPVGATVASRTMLLGGLVVLSFILYHLAHFTLGITNPEYEYLVDAQNRPDIYAMVIAGFQNIYVVGFYVLAQGFLALHLSHGFSSAARTFGVGSAGYRVFLRGGKMLAGLIFMLYVSIPLSVLAGLVHN